MNYFGIIKKAYHLTLKNRFLWIFGILAGGYGGFRGYNFGTSDFLQNSNGNLNNFNFDSFWSQYGGLVASIGLIMAILFFVLFILNIISQGALIGSVAKLSSGEKVDFNEGFHTGWKKFWRVLGTMVIYFLIILAVILLWITPTVLFAAVLSVPFAIFWGILFFLAVVAFFFLVAVISPYSFRAVVLKNKSITESISDSVHLCRENLATVIVIYLLLFAIGMAFGIAIFIAVVLIGALLFGIGFVAFLASGVLGIFYAVVVGAFFLAAIVTLAGAYGAFSSAVITLTYQELLKKS